MKRILMIDDEEHFCRTVKLDLERSGDFSVKTTTNPKECIKLAREIRPDLILLDIMMPAMDGYKVLKKLKKDRATSEIPVIMLSALSDEESQLKALELYNEAYITKPIENTELRNKIETVLKRKRTDA